VRRRPARRLLHRIALAAAALWPLAHARPARAQAPDPAAPTPASAEPAPPPIAEPPPPPPPPAEPAAAAEPPPSLAELVDVFDDKNRVPQNPALDILDANSLNVVKPGGVKDLGTDLRALYAGGKIVPQIAVEVSPYALVYGKRTTYEDYQRHAYVPILHRLSLSVATTNAGDAPNQATIAALGARVRLLDRSDWRLDRAAVSCAIDAATIAKPPAKPGAGVVVVPDEGTSAQEARKVRECFDKARKRVGTWNAEQVAIGAALSSAFPGGKLQADIRDLTAWASWGSKLRNSGLLVLTGKYLFADTRKDGDTRIPARHAASLAAEVERRGDRFGALGSVGLGRQWSSDTAAMTWIGAWVGQVGAGVQLRVSDATWVELRSSVQIVEGEDGTFVSLANFKYSFEVRPAQPKAAR
jgi:hypothetical protein